jgi:hypothetical protein
MPGQLDVPQAVFAKKNRLIADARQQENCGVSSQIRRAFSPEAAREVRGL